MKNEGLQKLILYVSNFDICNILVIGLLKITCVNTNRFKNIGLRYL